LAGFVALAFSFVQSSEAPDLCLELDPGQQPKWRRVLLSWHFVYDIRSDIGFDIGIASDLMSNIGIVSDLISDLTDILYV